MIVLALPDPVVILSKLTAVPTARETLFEALEPFMLVADAEPGTLAFTLYESSSNPDVVWMFEVYRDEKAYRAHVESPLHRTLKEEGKLTGGLHLAHLLLRPPENRFLMRKFHITLPL